MKRLHEEKIDDAAYYDTEIWAEEVNQRPFFDAVRMRALIEPVNVGDRILDVGAGVYGACQYISEEGAELPGDVTPRLDLVCIDQSRVARDLTIARSPEIDYHVGQFEEGLPFADEAFDVVIAGEVIEHMEDPAKFAADLCRASSRDVSLSTVDTTCENAIAHGEYPEHLWEFTPEDLLGFFEPFGTPFYTLVGDYHFIHWSKHDPGRR